jgi:hypothetical protein
MAHPAKKMVVVNDNIRNNTSNSPNGVAGENVKICNERLHDVGCESVACTQQLRTIERLHRWQSAVSQILSWTRVGLRRSPRFERGGQYAWRLVPMIAFSSEDRQTRSWPDLAARGRPMSDPSSNWASLKSNHRTRQRVHTAGMNAKDVEQFA